MIERFKLIGFTFMRVRKEMNIALVVSLVLVICIEFWWRDIPPLFGWSKAYRIADVSTNLLLSYVAGWIFFFINDHWHDVQDRLHVSAQVNRRVGAILATAHTLLWQLSLYVRNAAIKKSIQELDKDDWRKVVAWVFTKPAFIEGGVTPWMIFTNLFRSFAKNTDEPIKTLLSEYPRFNPELNEKLDAIRIQLPQMDFGLIDQIHVALTDHEAYTNEDSDSFVLNFTALHMRSLIIEVDGLIQTVRQDPLIVGDTGIKQMTNSCERFLSKQASPM